MGRPIAAGGRLCVCRWPRHRGDRRAIDRLLRHSAGGWLCRLQSACAWAWRRDPARFLSRPCQTQIRRGVQDNAVAVRPRGDRAPASDLRHRGRDPRIQRRTAACRPPHQDCTADGAAEGAADLDARPAVLPVEADGGHHLYAQSLGRTDAVSSRRSRRGRFQQRRAFHAPDCNGKAQLIVQRQRGRRRELGNSCILGQYGKAPRTRSAGLSGRRARAHRLRSDQEPPVARTSRLELEGGPRPQRTGGCMSRRRRSSSSSSSMAAAAMPLDELESWLQARAEQHPVATSLPALDGYVAAIVAGPVSMSPPNWICPLLAIDADAFNHGGTPEFAAISAVALRHNDISNTLSTAPHRFTPIHGRKPNGDVDARPWCQGFHAAMRLRLSAWAPLLDI